MEARRNAANLARCMAAIVAIALSQTPARALINQNYTPVDIVHQSEAILRLQVGPWDKANNRLAFKVVGKPLTGTVPRGFALTVDSPDEAVSNAIEKVLKTRTPAAAMVFLGDFSEARDEELDGAEQLVGAAYVGMEWFALAKVAGGAFRLQRDIYDLKTVWAGGNDMLAALVHYVQSDSRAEAPISTSTNWASGESTRLAAPSTPLVALLPLREPSANPPSLLALSRGGDRLYCGGRVGELKTKSSLSAVGHFNGDRLLDTAFWAGGEITLDLMRKEGGTVTRLVSPKAKQCIALSALPVGGGGQEGLLISTPNRPLVMTLDDKGSAKMHILQAPDRALGLAGPCVVADFDSDGLADVVQPFAKGVLLYRGMKGGRYGRGLRVAELQGSGTIATTLAGDYDADGRLDILIGGQDGCAVLTNVDGRTFTNVTSQTGELIYISKPNVTGAANCDINNDGRQDVVLFYADMPMQVFFNRGFRCFGFANLLDLKNSQLPAATALRAGQTAGTVVDFNSDGVQDVVAATKDGRLHALLRDPKRGGNLGVTVALSDGVAGPVTVVGYDGKRCLGARNVTAGRRVMFGKRTKGPLTLKWKCPGGRPQSSRIIVLRPTNYVMPSPAKN